jgi:hypothetical protein
MNAPATEGGHALQRSAYRSLAQTQAALQHRERQIDAMQRITNILLLNQSVDDPVRETLQATIDVLNAAVGSLQLYDAQSETLVLRHAIDPNAPMVIGLCAVEKFWLAVAHRLKDSSAQRKASNAFLTGTQHCAWNHSFQSHCKLLHVRDAMCDFFAADYESQTKEKSTGIVSGALCPLRTYPNKQDHVIPPRACHSELARNL